MAKYFKQLQKIHRIKEIKGTDILSIAMNLKVLDGKYAVYKFKSESALPGWIYSSEFYSITKTSDEISVVAIQTDLNSKEIICTNNDWRIIKIEGPLDFTMVGILADFSSIFSKKNISIFTVSTFDTDYILVKQKDLNTGIQSLIENGHNISP
jgi:uncharacterized protein